jgi:hypothetical protein
VSIAAAASLTEESERLGKFVNSCEDIGFHLHVAHAALELLDFVIWHQCPEQHGAGLCHAVRDLGV